MELAKQTRWKQFEPDLYKRLVLAINDRPIVELSDEQVQHLVRTRAYVFRVYDSPLDHEKLQAYRMDYSQSAKLLLEHWQDLSRLELEAAVRPQLPGTAVLCEHRDNDPTHCQPNPDGTPHMTCGIVVHAMMEPTSGSLDVVLRLFDCDEGWMACRKIEQGLMQDISLHHSRTGYDITTREVSLCFAGKRLGTRMLGHIDGQHPLPPQFTSEVYKYPEPRKTADLIRNHTEYSHVHDLLQISPPSSAFIHYLENKCAEFLASSSDSKIDFPPSSCPEIPAPFLPEQDNLVIAVADSKAIDVPMVQADSLPCSETLFIETTRASLGTNTERQEPKNLARTMKIIVKSVNEKHDPASISMVSSGLATQDENHNVEQGTCKFFDLQFQSIHFVLFFSSFAFFLCDTNSFFRSIFVHFIFVVLLPSSSVYFLFFH